MSLWIYKNNNRGNFVGYVGDWVDFFEEAKKRGGEWTWGGPQMTTANPGRKLANSAQIGQEFLAWQRWGKPPAYPKPKNLAAAAIGIVKLVDWDPTLDPGAEWTLKIVDQFRRPVPLLEYRKTDTDIDQLFRPPAHTFRELTSAQDKAVRRICSTY